MTRTLGQTLALLFLHALPLRENAHPWTPPAAPDFWQQEMLDQVNAIRAKGCRCGSKRMPPAPPLTWNDQLARAANSHATDMHRNHFLGHRGSNGSRIGQRAERAGYRWQAIAENVSWNTETVQSTVIGWRDSPGHCLSMMNRDYRDMGAAHVGAYWAQVFGRKME